MFTQKTKRIVQKFTVLVMLFSFVQSSWAGLSLESGDFEHKNAKIAYSTIKMLKKDAPALKRLLHVITSGGKITRT